MQVIDSMPEVSVEEPERSTEQKLQDAQKAVAGSVPLIPEAPDTIVHLPRGLYRDGKWVSDMEVRELTGVDEEGLARFKDPMDFFNGVIVYGVARIGLDDLEGLPFAERSSILAELLLGEREQIFLHIAMATYGDEKKITHTCPFCATEADTTLLISEDIKIPEMEDAHTLAHTLVTGKGQEISYHLATGSDQMAVFDRKGASIAEQNTIMISQCITHVNGGPVLDPLGLARKLSMGDRHKLLEAMVGAQPNPEMTLKLDCISCGEEMTLPLSWQDLFRYQ